MEGKTPVILSSDTEVKETFRRMIGRTTDAIITSYGDDAAYSGMDVYELRSLIERLGFLPEHGKGFDETLDTVRQSIMPHLLRTWSPMYMPHLHAPALTETIASELIIGAFNDSMDSWDQGPAATEVEEAMIHGLFPLRGVPLKLPASLRSEIVCTPCQGECGLHFVPGRHLRCFDFLRKSC